MFYERYAEYPGFKGAIFGAGKRCAPPPSKKQYCKIMPESRVAEDAWGEHTDIRRGDLPIHDYDKPPSPHLRPDFTRPQEFAWGRYERIRPRYGNSGSMFIYACSLFRLQR